MILVCQRGGACSDDGEAFTFTSLHCAAYGATMCCLVFRHPRSHRSNEMALRMMYELCLNIRIAIGADTITCNPCGSTRASVYGCSAGYQAMGGVCSIDLQCSGVRFSKCAQLGHGPERHERTFGHKGHQCGLVSLDLECQAHDAYLPIHLSWWSAAVKVGVSTPPTVNP